jgi:hypothetical protein
MVVMMMLLMMRSDAITRAKYPFQDANRYGARRYGSTAFVCSTKSFGVFQ